MNRLAPAILLVASVVAAACSVDPNSDLVTASAAVVAEATAVADPDTAVAPSAPVPMPTESPLPESPLPESSRALGIVYEEGTCFSARGSDDFGEPRDCSESHTAEIYAVRSFPQGRGEPFEDLAAATELCDQDFVVLTGVSIHLASVYQRSLLRPSEATWLLGDREVVCYVVYPEAIVDRLSDVDPLRSFGLAATTGLAVGDCILDYMSTYAKYELVACDEPHLTEVFVALQLPDGPYPGDEALIAQADELCFGERFETFVGRTYVLSSLLSLRSWPTEETWEFGDRGINCLVSSGEEHRGSFEGAGI